MEEMEIIADIAHGGFGRVQKAVDSKGRTVALKTFDPRPDIVAVSGIDTLKKRFIREVKVQSLLPDEFFIPIFESNTTSPDPFFTMPFAEDEFQNEIEKCRKTGKIPITALSEIINALAKLHSLGIVHRDLKPSNILKQDGRWKLSDFGLEITIDRKSTRLNSSH